MVVGYDERRGCVQGGRGRLLVGSYPKGKAVEEGGVGFLVQEFEADKASRSMVALPTRWIFPVRYLGVCKESSRWR
jgi:hypothetical protein